MQAVLERYAKKSADVINKRLSNKSLNAIEKFQILILEFMLVDTEYNKEMLEYIHKTQNAAYHQQSLVYGVTFYSKIIEEIIVQGVKEGFFDVKDTKLTAQFLISGISFLYDIHLFGWNKNEFAHMIRGLKDILKRLLNTKEEYFLDLDTIADRILEIPDLN